MTALGILKITSPSYICSFILLPFHGGYLMLSSD